MFVVMRHLGPESVMTACIIAFCLALQKWKMTQWLLQQKYHYCENCRHCRRKPSHCQTEMKPHCHGYSYRSMVQRRGSIKIGCHDNLTTFHFCPSIRLSVKKKKRLTRKIIFIARQLAPLQQNWCDNLLPFPVASLKDMISNDDRESKRVPFASILLHKDPSSSQSDARINTTATDRNNFGHMPLHPFATQSTQCCPRTGWRLACDVASLRNSSFWWINNDMPYATILRPVWMLAAALACPLAPSTPIITFRPADNFSTDLLR